MRASVRACKCVRVSECVRVSACVRVCECVEVRASACKHSCECTCAYTRKYVCVFECDFVRVQVLESESNDESM